MCFVVESTRSIGRWVLSDNPVVIDPVVIDPDCVDVVDSAKNSVGLSVGP